MGPLLSGINQPSIKNKIFNRKNTNQETILNPKEETVLYKITFRIYNALVTFFLYTTVSIKTPINYFIKASINSDELIEHKDCIIKDENGSFVLDENKELILDGNKLLNKIFYY